MQNQRDTINLATGVASATMLFRDDKHTPNLMSQKSVWLCLKYIYVYLC